MLTLDNREKRRDERDERKRVIEYYYRVIL